MVICDRPVVDVCPVEWGRMPGRSVLQWDKDDCARVGLVKFDLLGLGMLTALQHTCDLVAEHHGLDLDLGRIPAGGAGRLRHAVRRRLGRGVPGREPGADGDAARGCKPRKFYDLVIEVALIRPGPIQGGSVHPYIRRRAGQEPADHATSVAGEDAWSARSGCRCSRSS